MGHEVVVLFDTKRCVRYPCNTSPFHTPVRAKNAVTGETRSNLTLHQITSDLHKYRVVNINLQ